jgi:hypothetical protein
MFHSKRIKLLLGNSGNFSQIDNQNLQPEIVFIDYYHMLYDRDQNETIIISEGESKPIIIVAILCHHEGDRDGGK